MEYFTEEEEYELRYEDDLDVLNEMESEYDAVNPKLNKHSEKFPVPNENTETVLHCGYDAKDCCSKSPKRYLSSEEEPLTYSIDLGRKKIRLTDEGSSESVVRSVDSTSYSSEFEKLPVTKSDGSKTYFCLYDEDKSETRTFSFSRNVSCVLSAPIEKLKMEAAALLEKIHDGCDLSVLPSETLNSDVCQKEEELWVEKYRPRTYVDLLSDEGINRTLLAWLKLWDKVVFGKDNKKTKPQKVQTGVPQQHQQSKFKKLLKELIEQPDEYGRPHHKVAFLCGPPGLGKTTLANIIANHAGYNVVEFNASDDRSPDVFRVNLEAATQMKAVLDQDRRPNCLVIDEIDGAPAPSINVLLSFIKSTGAVRGKRSKGDLPILMRPVICICNDQYTPALKLLRQLALVLNFPPTSTRRLSSRLNEVALTQQFRADPNAITLLCEKADNDIRSCLSTLQFIYNQKKELLISDISGMEIGMKDVQKTLFAVWIEIFYISKKKMKVPKMLSYLENEVVKSNDSSVKFRFSKVLNSVQTCSEYEKVLSGLFENYLKIKFKDAHMEAIWQGPQWLCFADIIQQEVSHAQLYTLMSYLPYCAVAFHMLYGCSTYPQISYPYSAYECSCKRTQFMNILASVISDIVAFVKRFLSMASLVLDLLPALVEIIKPTLRPVNIQLYSNQEKAELDQIINVMIAFNLNYRQERSVEGQYSFVLEPNVEELVYFPGLKPKQVLTYATKQLIAREVELEKMRQHESCADLSALQPTRLRNQKANSGMDLKQKPKKILSGKQSRDFFGRKIEDKAIVPSGDNIKRPDENESKDGIWFHFKEGYSNAVRRTVWIQDLL